MAESGQQFHQPLRHHVAGEARMQLCTDEWVSLWTGTRIYGPEPAITKAQGLRILSFSTAPFLPSHRPVLGRDKLWAILEGRKDSGVEPRTRSAIITIPFSGD